MTMMDCKCICRPYIQAYEAAVMDRLYEELCEHDRPKKRDDII